MQIQKFSLSSFEKAVETNEMDLLFVKAFFAISQPTTSSPTGSVNLEARWLFVIISTQDTLPRDITDQHLPILVVSILLFEFGYLLSKVKLFLWKCENTSVW